MEFLFCIFCFALGYDLSRLQKKKIKSEIEMLNSFKEEMKDFVQKENELIRSEIKSLKNRI